MHLSVQLHFLTDSFLAFVAFEWSPYQAPYFSWHQSVERASDFCSNTSNTHSFV